MATFTVADAQAREIAGNTSRGGVISVGISKQNKLQWLIVELSARCSDNVRRTFWPGFRQPFKHSQHHAGVISDSYNIVGRSLTTGARFRQRARFTAQISAGHVSGTAQGTQTLLASGVVCKSPAISFKLHL